MILLTRRRQRPPRQNDRQSGCPDPALSQMASLRVSASEPSPVPADFGEGHRVGQIGDPLLLECSGIDASTRRSDVLWAINDEGEGLYLFALGLDGRARGRVLVRDAQNRDCEALDAFRWKGESFLLIADTGNNRGRRRAWSCTLSGSRPWPPSDSTAAPWWTWPGGSSSSIRANPRDAEAVAVDVSTGSVLVVTKREFRPLLFVLPLNPPAGAARRGPGGGGGRSDAAALT